MFRETHITPRGEVANVRELADDADPTMSTRLHTSEVRCVVAVLAGGGSVVFEALEPDLELDPTAAWSEHCLSRYDGRQL